MPRGSEDTMRDELMERWQELQKRIEPLRGFL